MIRSKLVRTTVATFLLMALTGVGKSAFAYSPGACREDGEKLCPGVKTDKELIPCLKLHEVELSTACKVNLAEARQMVRDTKDACEPDIQKHCAGVQYGQGRIRKCLKAHEADLSSACKEQITTFRKKYDMEVSTSGNLKINGGSRSSFLIALSLLSIGLQANASDPYATERETMVREQIKRRDVKDPRVLAALQKVPRHHFVPRKLQSQAYLDTPLPIGEGQTISQPYIVGVMSELLALQGHEKVLEIGTGSGYQAAVLSEIAGEVYSIEIIPSLAAQAKRVLGAGGYKNIYLKTGDGYAGWPEKAPFDAIIVTCAPDAIPPAFQNQLKEGGRMVIPVGNSPNQTLYVILKQNGALVPQPVFPVRFVPMVKSE